MKRRHARKRRSPAWLHAFKRARSKAKAVKVLTLLSEALPFAAYLPVGMREREGACR